MEPITVEGRVSQVGYYWDCVPTLAIFFRKNEKNSSLFPAGERVEMTLVVADHRYRVGLRTTLKMLDVKLCPDLIDEKGANVRLADIVLGIGLVQRSKVTLVIDGEIVILTTRLGN